MDEKELQALYNAVSQKFDIGDYNSFKSKMQTTKQRKSFYDVVGGKGFDIGDYESYENRIGGVKEKESSTSAIGQSQSSEKGIANRFPFNLLIQGKVAQDEEMSFKTNDPLSFAKRKKYHPHKKNQNGVKRLTILLLAYQLYYNTTSINYLIKYYSLSTYL